MLKPCRTSLHPMPSSAGQVQGIPVGRDGDRLVSETANPEASFEEQDAAEQFNLLADFLETYLKKQLDLLEQYFSGCRGKVSFENLWMLFGVEELIYCPFKKGDCRIYNEGSPNPFRTTKRDGPHAYRVISCIGGLPKTALDKTPQQQSRQNIVNESLNGTSSAMIRHRHEGQNAINSRIRERYSSLCVDCYCIAIDGSKFMAAPDAFEFKPYEGELDIVSLEVYPMRYRQGANDAVKGSFDDLTDRGARFVDLTTVSHKAYHGQTVGDADTDVKEEVSQIYSRYRSHD